MQSSSKTTAPHPVRSWHTNSHLVSLSMDPSRRLSATVSKGNFSTVIQAPWIEGIPREATVNPERLRGFLGGTYIQLRPLGTDGWKVIVLHRLKGGVEEPESSMETTPQVDPQALSYVRQAIAQARIAQGKDLVVFVGNTGTGKSTLVNRLSGSELVYIQRSDGSYGVTTREGHPQPAPIGHSLTQSTTLFTTLHRIGDHTYAADAGGFLETRGQAAKLAATLSLIYTLRNARSVKLVICLDYKELVTTRAQRTPEVVAKVFSFLINQEKRNVAKPSVMFLFTRAEAQVNPITQAVETPTTETVISFIRTCIESLASEDPRRAVFEYIIRENGRYVLLSDPTSIKSRDDTLALIQSLPSITAPKEVFNTPYGSETEQALALTLITVSNKAKRIHQRYKEAVSQQERLLAEQTTLQQNLSTLEAAIQQLETGSEGLTAIQALRTTHQQQLADSLQEKAACEANLQTQQPLSDAAESAHAAHVIDGESEIVYYQESSNPNDDTFIHQGVPKIKLKFSWKIFPTGLKAVVDITTGIKKTFSYRGPKIERIELTPTPSPSTTCWKNETKDEKNERYSVTYEVTAQGTPPAQGEVKIYTKKKFSLEYQERKKELESSMATEQRTLKELRTNLTSLDAQIQSHRNSILNLEISGLGKNFQITQSKTEKLQTSNRLAAITHDLAKATEAQSHYRGKMDVQRQDLLFVHDFLSLCDNQPLKSRPLLVEFLTNYTEYTSMMTQSSTLS